MEKDIFVPCPALLISQKLASSKVSLQATYFCTVIGSGWSSWSRILWQRAGVNQFKKDRTKRESEFSLLNLRFNDVVI